MRMQAGEICISWAFMNDDLLHSRSWLFLYLYSRVTVALIAVGLLQDVTAVSLHFTLSMVDSRCAHSPACLRSAEDLWVKTSLGAVLKTWPHCIRIKALKLSRLDWIKTIIDLLRPLFCWQWVNKESQIIQYFIRLWHITRLTGKVKCGLFAVKRLKRSKLTSRAIEWEWVERQREERRKLWEVWRQREAKRAPGRCFTEVSAVDKLFMTLGQFSADIQELDATRPLMKVWWPNSSVPPWLSQSNSTFSMSHYYSSC